MKRILLTMMMVVVMATVAYADIFGTDYKDLIVIGEPTFNSKTEAKSLGSAGTLDQYPQIFDIINRIVQTLGTREGVAYDMANKEFINYAGATVYTYKNLSLNTGILDIDGVALSVDYNVGALLNVNSIPMLKYLDYLHTGAFGGYRPNEDRKGAYGFDAQFKLTF